MATLTKATRWTTRTTHGMSWYLSINTNPIPGKGGDHIKLNTHSRQRTGPPVSPNWSRTLIISIGWMIAVDIMPESPPLTNGFTVFHTEPESWLAIVNLQKSNIDGTFSLQNVINIIMQSNVIQRLIYLKRKKTRNASGCQYFVDGLLQSSPVLFEKEIKLLQMQSKSK